MNRVTIVGVLALCTWAALACGRADGKGGGAAPALAPAQASADAAPAFRRFRLRNRANSGSIKNISITLYMDASSTTEDASIAYNGSNAVPDLVEVEKGKSVMIEAGKDFNILAGDYRKVVVAWELYNTAATPVKIASYTATFVAQVKDCPAAAPPPQSTYWSKNWFEEVSIMQYDDQTAVVGRSEHVSGDSLPGVPYFSTPAVIVRTPG